MEGSSSPAGSGLISRWYHTVTQGHIWAQQTSKAVPSPVLLPGSTPSKTLPLKTSWVNLGLWSFWSVTMMEMFMGSSTEAPFSDTAWPKSYGYTGLGSAWRYLSHQALGPCFSLEAKGYLPHTWQSSPGPMAYSVTTSLFPSLWRRHPQGGCLPQVL